MEEKIEKIVWFCLGCAFVVSILITYLIYSVRSGYFYGEDIFLIYGLGIFVGIMISASARFLALSLVEILKESKSKMKKDALHQE